MPGPQLPEKCFIAVPHQPKVGDPKLIFLYADLLQGQLGTTRHQCGVVSVVYSSGAKLEVIDLKPTPILMCVFSENVSFCFLFFVFALGDPQVSSQDSCAGQRFCRGYATNLGHTLEQTM